LKYFKASCKKRAFKKNPIMIHCKITRALGIKQNFSYLNESMGSTILSMGLLFQKLQGQVAGQWFIYIYEHITEWNWPENCGGNVDRAGMVDVRRGIVLAGPRVKDKEGFRLFLHTEKSKI
jgi:hypothetical protein